MSLLLQKAWAELWAALRVLDSGGKKPAWWHTSTHLQGATALPGKGAAGMVLKKVRLSPCFYMS